MNINEMLKQAKKLQAEMELKEKQISKKEFVVEKQGIKLVMFGTRKIKSLEINELLIDPEDAETLQDLIIITVNEAIEKINQEYEELSKQVPTTGLPF
ncbi:YbaB/EbfC family nucleoid-associated protein [[Mycoplasma] gypis]|uniref:Nucleoid-associated protein WG616_03010 n=1 Tax=[Mycoplasma] gypis TaxID=92404 RepID=A0ABZ2RRN1_9BACT|nr:YbaB/EbfC family nucleoid-associated protein [[Mycoplasma] gypis]MBN0919665.1 YbaB/EbfC family nucleoid-associated protein [[Mycoplasma] gypis]